jgi:tetratricopeptide (TPR) repeat protein/predicted Ser/Thr protein kinase
MVDLPPIPPYIHTMGKGTVPLQCPKCYTLNPDDSRFCSKCGATLDDLFETRSYAGPGAPETEDVDHFMPGEMFDRRYRIIEEIGWGGMGRVFKAEDTELNITVALKIIRPRFSSNPRFIEQFKKEMLLARSISHENVIRIFDLGEAHRTKYISMEYIKGQNLKEFLHASGTLAIETVVHIARQIGEALKFAHAKGIIHQDLKPANIMVDQSGRVYIMDFGLARAVYGADAGKPGEIAGTPQYMSPEQAKGEKIGQASDIYSYGAILYEIATGRPMFKADTPAEYREKHVSERPVPPAKVNPRLPKQLEHIIFKCLEKDPARRYQNIAEILADLNQLERTGAATFAGWAKSRWVYGLTAIFFLVVAAFVYYFLINPHLPPVPPGKSPSLAVMYLTNNTGDKGLNYMRQTLSELLIADLLQSQYVRVLTGDKIYGILKTLNLLDAPAYSSEELKKVASKAKVDYILQGSFTKAKDQFRINTSLHRVDTMEVLNAEREQWTGDDSMYSMIESLTQKIKEDIKLPAAALSKDIHKDLRKITTGSTEAFKYYVEAKRLYEEQKFEQSLKALDRAVSLDPEFAMAYRLMAEDYFYLRNGEQYKKYMSKAMSLLNRVSDREFYMIQGFAASSPREAVDIYKKLLALYPEDTDALGELGAEYRNLEEWPLAARQFEKILSIDNTNELAYENLSLIYMAQGEYQKAVDLLKSRLDAFSGWFSFHNRLATAYLCLHQYDLALEEARKAGTIESADFEPTELEGLIHLVKGDRGEAEASFRRLIESDNPQFQLIGRAWLCHLYLMLGKYDRLREEIKAGLEHARTVEMSSELRATELYMMNMLAAYICLRTNELPPAYEALTGALEAAQESDRSDYVGLALHFRGLALAKMKRFQDARAAAEKLREHIEKVGVMNELRLYHRLTGEIAREEGDLTKAVSFFETALSLLPHQNYKSDIHILFFDSLASAYFQKGDWDKAQKCYEQIISLTTGRLRWGDLYSKSFYWLGKIYQAQNQQEKAAEFYRRFLDIWCQADRGLPEIGDARKCFAALAASPR